MHHQDSHARRAVRVVAAVVAVTSIVACSSSAGQDDSSVTAATSEAYGSSSGSRLCPVTSEYFVLTPVGSSIDDTCPAISAKNGAWTKAAGWRTVDCTPTDASLTGKGANLCSYDWSSKSGASPDVSALLAVPGAYVAAAGGSNVGANCDADAALRVTTMLDRAAEKCTLHNGIDGSKGCDVCGRKMMPGVSFGWLVLPPSPPLGTMAVKLSNGATEVVTLNASASSNHPTNRSSTASFGYGGFVDLELPAPPRGVAYVDGAALGYAYAAPAGSP